MLAGWPTACNWMLTCGAFGLPLQASVTYFKKGIPQNSMHQQWRYAGCTQHIVAEGLDLGSSQLGSGGTGTYCLLVHKAQSLR